jgi:response regulator RpfG family c-di-GMP phosphodiesterase
VLIVPIEQAEPGMKLAITVTHPDNPAQELLRRNFVIDRAVLDRMSAIGVTCLFVDYPGLEDLDRHLAPHLSPERQVLYQKVKTSLTDFQRSAAPTATFTDYYEATRDFISALLTNGRNPIFLDEMSISLGADGVRHSMAVAHLALVMGIRLERYLIDQRSRLSTSQAREVVNLGVAATLHDVGKTRLPESLRQFSGLTPPTGKAERAEWEAHPRVGYEMLHNHIEVTAAAAVLHHHQHFDGSGFPPRDLNDGTRVIHEGQRIHIYARILLAADLYDRLTRADDGKTRRTNLEILHLMRTRYAAWLDPEIVSILPAVIPPFPPGTRVTLSDGRHAIVSAPNADNPYRPIVKILAADARTLTDQAIPLARTPDLSVVKVGTLDIDHKQLAA